MRPGAPAQEIRLEALRHGNVIAFESLRFESNGSQADLHGQIMLGEIPAFTAYADLARFDPRSLWETQTSARPWSLSGTVRLEGSGLTRAEFVGKGTAHWRSSSFLGLPFDSADLSFSGNRGSFSFSQVDLAHAGARVQGQASISASDQLAASFEGNVSDLASLGAFVPALESGFLQGEAVAQVELEGPIREPKAEATLRFADASIFGANAHALELWIHSPRLGERFPGRSAIERRANWIQGLACSTGHGFSRPRIGNGGDQGAAPSLRRAGRDSLGRANELPG